MRARYQAFFEEVQMRSMKILRLIHHDLFDMLGIFIPKSGSFGLDAIGFQQLHLPIVQVVQKRGQWLRWEPPSRGCYKLNTDGSCRRSLF